MEPIPKKLRCSSPSRENGVALVLVLAFLVLITGLAVAFFSTVSTDYSTSMSYASTARAKTLGDTAVQIVMGQIKLATSGSSGNNSNVAWASQPGMIRTWGGASVASNAPLAYYKLYSSDNMVVGSSQTNSFDMGNDVDTSWDQKPALFTDLNAPVSSSGTSYFPIIDPRAAGNVPVSGVTGVTGNSLVDGFSYTKTMGSNTIDGVNLPASVTDSSARLPMPVKWLYQLQDGTLIAADPSSSGTATFTQATTPPTAGNPIVARLAFWTDDETCKLNINTATEGSYWDTPMYSTTQDVSFMYCQPANKEYSRYPGHPATTSLSPALWSFLGMQSPYDYTDALLSPNLAGSVGSAAYPASSFAAPQQPQLPYSASASGLYQTIMNSVAPRSTWGGSQAGSATTLASGATIPTIVPNVNRLFASVDELLFSGTYARAPRPTTGGINTPNGISDVASGISLLRFFLTANSRAPEVNQFNQPKVTLWPVPQLPAKRSPSDNLLTFCSTLNNNAYYFTRNDPTSTSADFTTRNLSIYTYLRSFMNQPVPGFGGTFNGKWTSAQCDQVLTEMYDYIRSCINLVDSSNNTGSGAFTFPYAYTTPPTQASGTAVATLNPGTGQVVPFIHPTNGSKGLGRFPTLRAATLWFIARAANQPPVLVDSTGKPIVTGGAWQINPMHPFCDMPTISGTALPTNYYPTISGTTHAGLPFLTGTLNAGAFTVSNPYYKGPTLPYYATQIEAVLILEPVDPAPGNVPMALNCQFRVSGLNGFTADSQSLGFPGNATETVAISTAASPSNALNPNCYNGFFHSISYAATVANRYTKGGQTYNTLPFYSTQVTLNNQNGDNGQTFNFGGGTIKIEVLTPDGNTVVQTLNMNFPGAKFPVPKLPPWWSNGYYPPYPPQDLLSVNLASPNNVHNKGPDIVPGWMLTFDRTDAIAGGMSRLVNSYLTSFRGTHRFFGPEMNPYTNGSYKDMNTLTCDTLRSVELTYGDTRMVAALQNVPTTFFSPNPYYLDGNPHSVHGFTTYLRAAHSIYMNDCPQVGTQLRGLTDAVPLGYILTGGAGSSTRGAGSAYSGPAGVNDPQTNTQINNMAEIDFSYLTPTIWSNNTGFNGTGPYTTAPFTTPTVDFNNSTFKNTVWANGGDFDNGQGLFGDGPFINKADEGDSLGKCYGDFSNAGINSSFGSASATLFSPNRQIASAVMFGSLPVGFAQAGSANMLLDSWQTLMFSPNPNASTAALRDTRAITKNQMTEAGSVPSGAVAPDHLLLDFFNMPVVEPYPISEPFSTAGKVNMNYQIAPFTYIHRDTALRGVLKSVMLTAVDDQWSQGYKYRGTSDTPLTYSYNAAYNTFGSNSGYQYFRYPIHTGETLKQFDARFSNTANGPAGDIFRSPSEICSLWLYPAKQAAQGQAGNPATPLVSWDANNANIKGWWYNNAGTARKSLTGDNMRERPYNSIYPRLTTKSNTYTVHFSVQVLKKVPSTPVNQWVENKDVVLSQYRGSSLIERYIDPADPKLPDFVTSNTTETLDNYYKFRVLSTKKFSPQ